MEPVLLLIAVGLEVVAVDYHPTQAVLAIHQINHLPVVTAHRLLLIKDSMAVTETHLAVVVVGVERLLSERMVLEEILVMEGRDKHQPFQAPLQLMPVVVEAAVQMQQSQEMLVTVELVVVVMEVMPQ